MYSLSQLHRAINQPKQALRELNRWYYTQFRQWEFNRSGTNVFDEDWDNLLILDACRHDTFADFADKFDLPGALESRESRGACTMEFLRGNVNEKDLRDTVYVAATTMMYRESVFKDELTVNFYDIIDVWEDSIDVGEWGILPSTMADQAREVVEEYPNKRVVVHFIQPHIPFLGPTAEEYDKQLDNTIWADCFNGSADVSDDIIRRAYRENVDQVFEEVEQLLTDLPGKTVVTADHGQFLGERASPIPIKEYGHPNGIYADLLVKVPWHVYNNGERKDIKSGTSRREYGKRRTDALDEKARNHLEQLGYLE